VGYLLAVGLLAGLAVLPVGIAPGWAVLAYIEGRFGLALLPLALAGAVGTATGKTALAAAARVFGPRVLGARVRRNLAHLAPRLQRRSGMLGVAGLLALSPPPASALYATAGLLRVNLTLVGLACLFGRLFAYSVSLATIRTAVVRLGISSGWGLIAGIVGSAAFLWLLVGPDWGAWLQRARAARRT
jgi:hypothetical protein